LSFFVDIFYPPNFGDFEENGVFQQPRLVSPTDFANRDFGRRLPRACRDILFPLFNAAN
jgi:hypothetical protein